METAPNFQLRFKRNCIESEHRFHLPDLLLEHSCCTWIKHCVFHLFEFNAYFNQIIHCNDHTNALDNSNTYRHCWIQLLVCYFRFSRFCLPCSSSLSVSIFLVAVSILCFSFSIWPGPKYILGQRTSPLLLLLLPHIALHTPHPECCPISPLVVLSSCLGCINWVELHCWHTNWLILVQMNICFPEWITNGWYFLIASASPNTVAAAVRGETMVDDEEDEEEEEEELRRFEINWFTR